MTVKPPVKLLLNDEESNHGKVLAKLLPETKHLECMVAFAKISGLKLIVKKLEESLKKGLSARFAVGLDFYLTEPELLRQLLNFRRRYQLEGIVKLTCPGRENSSLPFSSRTTHTCLTPICKASPHHLTVMSRFEQMATWAKMIVDGGKRGQKSLCLAGRFKSSPASFALSRWLM